MDPCAKICRNISECTWFSSAIIHSEYDDDYSGEDGEEMERYKCIFYKDCIEIKEAQSGFKSSQKNCLKTKESSKKAMCSITGDRKSCLSPELAPRSLKLSLKGLKEKAEKSKKPHTKQTFKSNNIKYVFVPHTI